MSTTSHRSESARDRLIDTARSLFLRHGVPNVGINRVISDAGIARMTLYNHFASKDDLVLAVFEREAEMRRESIAAIQETLNGPYEKILALFTVALDLAGREGFRGCAFLNLAIEAAAPDSRQHILAQAHKKWIRANVSGNLPPEVFADPKSLAGQIIVLWDGGIVGAYVQQSDAPIRTARDAARTLMRGTAL